MIGCRYRPNIVFKGSGVPFAEDFWRHIRITSAAAEGFEEGAAFSVVSKCVRCMVSEFRSTHFECRHRALIDNGAQLPNSTSIPLGNSGRALVD